MLGRVTQQSIINDFTNNTMRRESELQDVQNQLSSGYRVNRASDDPVATINYMDFDSRLTEIDTYSSIIGVMQNKSNLIDSQLDEVTNLLQRARELSVQMSNGTYGAEERRNAAMEIDQIARQVLLASNSYYKDTALFGGTASTQPPFVGSYNTDPESGMEILTGVRYLGNNQAQIVEIDRNETVVMAQPGNQIFWANNMTIIPTTPVEGYTAPTDSTIIVDGKKIDIAAGDNLEVIAGKINAAGLAVRASVETENQQSIFMLETTSPHQITLMDSNGGTVLSDLGLIDSNMASPYNYSPSAKVYTGSVFDVLIEFRDALLDNDQFAIGGRTLGGLDQSIGNVLKYRAHMGAVNQRMQSMLERYLADESYYTDAKQTAVGTDITRAMMEMKMLEFAHEVALNIGARVMPKTLLDFMR